MGERRRGPAGIVLLPTSHRVPPGLLAWPAWEAVRVADRVVTREADHPQRPYVEAAGIPVEVVADASDRELALALVEGGRSGTVVLLSGPDGDQGLARALAAELTAAAEAGVSAVPDLEVLPGSWDLPGARLLDLVSVMDRLRSPGGCPWDAEQTHSSLVHYLLEESYETVEAIETGDLTGLREELGDLLLQVVFHARIGEEHADEPWTIDDVAAGIVEKLVRRHPHVFAGSGDAPTADHVEANWEVLKAAEKQRTSVLDGVPLALPALVLASKLLTRAAKSGVDVAARELTSQADRAVADEAALGELLLGVVAAARRHGVDAEGALRGACRRYADRVRAAEAGG